MDDILNDVLSDLKVNQTTKTAAKKAADIDSMLDDLANDFDFSTSNTPIDSISLQDLVSQLPRAQYTIASNYANKPSPLGIFGGGMSRQTIATGVPSCPQCFLMLSDKKLAHTITKHIVDDLPFITSAGGVQPVLSNDLLVIGGFVTHSARESEKEIV